jgi:hypothetical protein
MLVFVGGLGWFLGETGKYLATKWFPKYMNSKLKQPEVRKTKLKEHSLFTRLSDMEEVQSNMMDIPCPVKKRLFSYMTSLRLQCLREEFLELVTDTNIDKIHPNDLGSVLVSCLNSSKLKWLNSIGRSDIPLNAITKYNQCRKPFDFILKSTIDDVCSTARYDYPSNSAKMVAIFDIIQSLETANLLSLETFLSTVNGSLCGMAFTIGGILYKCEEQDKNNCIENKKYLTNVSDGNKQTKKEGENA